MWVKIDTKSTFDRSCLSKFVTQITFFQAPLAPLHNPPNLMGIKLCIEAFPLATQVAAFDTARSLPSNTYCTTSVFITIFDYKKVCLKCLLSFNFDRAALTNVCLSNTIGPDDISLSNWDTRIRQDPSATLTPISVYF